MAEGMIATSRFQALQARFETVVEERDRLEARISARHTRALEAEKEVARLRFEVAGLKHLVEAHLRSSVDAVSADDALRAAYVALSANRASEGAK